MLHCMPPSVLLVTDIIIGCLDMLEDPLFEAATREVLQVANRMHSHHWFRLHLQIVTGGSSSRTKPLPGRPS